MNAVEELLSGMDRVTVFWAGMHGIYGDAWARKWSKVHQGVDKGTRVAKAAWDQTLSRYSAQEIASAMEVCKTKHSNFPPSLGEFELLVKAQIRPTSAPRLENKATPNPDLPARRTALQVLSSIRAARKASPIADLLKICAQAVVLADPSRDEARELKQLENQILGKFA